MFVVLVVVDEVTQFEYVGAVPAISERFLFPVLEVLLALFPCAILGSHADDGSEYVNHHVAALLAKLRPSANRGTPFLSVPPRIPPYLGSINAG